MSLRDERICRRTARLLTRRPHRLGLTFSEENGSLTLDSLLNIPLFKRRQVTLEQLTNALSNDSENRFTIESGSVRLTNPPPAPNGPVRP